MKRPDPRRLAVRAAIFLAALLGCAVLFVLWADCHVERSVEESLYADLSSVPETDAALVLGTSKYVAAGRPNIYYMPRIRAAAGLFLAGKVRGIVVSGDNATMRYNEPQRMKEDLVALGVPPEFITCDYAGFRTLDSVVRMRSVFSMDRYVIVSQRFHAARALYIAAANGQRPIGFAAEDAPEGLGAKVRLREVLARAVAVLDVFILDTEPKFLGEPVKVTLKER